MELLQLINEEGLTITVHPLMNGLSSLEANIMERVTIRLWKNVILPMMSSCLQMEGRNTLREIVLSTVLNLDLIKALDLTANFKKI